MMEEFSLATAATSSVKFNPNTYVPSILRISPSVFLLAAMVLSTAGSSATMATNLDVPSAVYLTSATTAQTQSA